MPDAGPPGRRGSEVLDAIWEQVAATPQRSDQASVLFRAKALDQLDVAADVDNQLPLVKRRTWLLLVGVAVVVAAFVLWASLTPSVTSLATQGRVIAAPGAIPVVATGAGVVLSTRVQAGDAVRAGDVVAVIRTARGDEPVRALGTGTAWQVLATTGDAVAPGSAVVTMLPPDSDRGALLVVPEASAAAVRPGMTVDLVSAAPVQGSVTSLTAPLPAAEAAQRTGLSLPPNDTYVLAAVQLEAPVTAGTAVNATVILSESTVIQRLLGRT